MQQGGVLLWDVYLRQARVRRCLLPPLALFDMAITDKLQQRG
jgi:hypothetical protein